MTQPLDELVRARMSWLSPVIRSWYDDTEVRAQLGSAMAPEADRVANDEFGAEFRDALGLAERGQAPVPDALDWANRRLELADGGWAVTGIRFRGRDAARAFVDVVATTASPTPDGLAVVSTAAGQAYDAFAPLCLRVDAPDAPGLVESLVGDTRFEPSCGVDMHVVAGQVRDLRAGPRATSYDRVTLRPGDAGVLTRRVAAIYAALAALEPGLSTWANPEDEESLRECAEEGLLFEVLVDGEPAGVVAALRDDDHGMRGFSVHEICLDPRHRGRRLAPPTVQRLVDQLPADDGDVLWGTIHPANVPSLRNALSIGRVLVGGYVWVTPSGWAGMPSTAR